MLTASCGLFYSKVYGWNYCVARIIYFLSYIYYLVVTLGGLNKHYARLLSGGLRLHGLDCIYAIKLLQ